MKLAVGILPSNFVLLISQLDAAFAIQPHTASSFQHLISSVSTLHFQGVF